jgi:hypothetical protein
MMRTYRNAGDAAFLAAYGNHVRDYAWDHWATMTPRFEARPYFLWKEFNNGFVRRLGWHAKQSVTWYAALERSPAGIYHIHALLAGTGALTCATVAAAWKLGRTDVDEYDPALGAPWYMTKTVHRPDEDWSRADMSRREPPRRTEEPGPRAA